jgi:hypothetical protein
VQYHLVPVVVAAAGVGVAAAAGMGVAAAAGVGVAAAAGMGVAAAAGVAAADGVVAVVAVAGSHLAEAGRMAVVIDEDEKEPVPVVCVDSLAAVEFVPKSAGAVVRTEQEPVGAHASAQPGALAPSSVQ